MRSPQIVSLFSHHYQPKYPWSWRQRSVGARQHRLPWILQSSVWGEQLASFDQATEDGSSGNYFQRICRQSSLCPRFCLIWFCIIIVAMMTMIKMSSGNYFLRICLVYVHVFSIFIIIIIIRPDDVMTPSFLLFLLNNKHIHHLFSFFPSQFRTPFNSSHCRYFVLFSIASSFQVADISSVIWFKQLCSLHHRNR